MKNTCHFFQAAFLAAALTGQALFAGQADGAAPTAERTVLSIEREFRLDLPYGRLEELFRSADAVASFKEELLANLLFCPPPFAVRQQAP